MRFIKNALYSEVHETVDYVQLMPKLCYIHKVIITFFWLSITDILCVSISRLQYILK